MDHQGAESALEKMRRDLEMLLPRNVTTSKVEVSTSGRAGIWIAIAMFAFMAGLNWSLNASLADQNRKIDRMQDHLNAIYMMAPQLKPPEIKP